MDREISMRTPCVGTTCKNTGSWTIADDVLTVPTKVAVRVPFVTLYTEVLIDPPLENT
ncbi:hypothetical protein DPMN_052366 [Dreissena polymorpha]|uniref:Uncharacterized protein n=1 Tax=Dreissena polymorpha TaxID=45954 RepID=A0A9D4CJK4_DREPO|nr:hypothetical protein DPMN_052366 [Dreissena polymorpha]